MKSHRIISHRVIALAACGLLAACDSSTEPQPDLAAQVRSETARFSATSAAIEAGYELEDHCVAHPDLGGMGYHWVNGPLIDTEFEAMRPEALLYERDGNGEFQLTGVEYIVVAAPGVALDGPARPDFDGHPFDIGGVPPLADAGVPHWSLHVWLHKDNPNGVFLPFNPSVSCAMSEGHSH